MLALFWALPVCGFAADDYYTEPQVFGMRPNPISEIEMGPIGVTGIEVRIEPGVKVTVESTQPGTPAQGKLRKGDIIVGVNGTMLQGKHPQVVLGTALTEAEAKDGVMTFDVKRGDNEPARKVTLKIPVLGAYSEKFPLNCGKSQQIVRKAAEFYGGKDRLKARSFLDALACLFLLSTGDDQYVPRVREYLGQFLNADGSLIPPGDHTWNNGYNGVACAEYYLRTGDESVLPLLQYYCDNARDRQKYGIGWGHWGYDLNPAYEAGGGLMHCAGAQVLLTLVMGKECGVNVDDKTLLGALKHWYRFAGHGTIPLSDQRYWMAHLRSAGRDGAAAAIMRIASHATGDVTIYRKASEYLAMSALTSWPEREYNWEVYWQSLAGPLVLDFNPELFHSTMRRFEWCLDLGRQASGAFYFPRDHDSLDPTESGISLALAYTAPLKKLQISGAPRSKHAKAFTLPAHLWGNKADLAFLDVKPSRDFSRYGAAEPIEITWRQLPNGLRGQYGPANAKGLDLETMLRNVRHERCEVRAAAAKALVFNQRFDEIEKLLRDPDPRLRRAALDGISDCNPWFYEPAIGRNALKREAFTPGMIDAISNIMGNPNEAWFVIDGAMIALACAPVEAIQRNISNIIPWARHDEWWLRESAFLALMGLQDDKTLFLKYLPGLINMMVKEYPYNPRHQMVLQLQAALAKAGNDSPVGRMIIAGFPRATVESKVLPDVGRNTRSVEGATNIVEVVLLAVQVAPESAAPLAAALVKSGQLKGMSDEILMKIIKDQDGEVSDRFVGLYPALQTLPAEQKGALTSLLYDEFRPELLRRLDASSADGKGKLLDMLVELTALRRPINGWQAIGAPPPAQREFRFRSFDPLTEAEKLDPRIEAPKRLRDVTLAPDMKDWHLPTFDDSAWNRGKTPIGVGVFTAHGHGLGWTATPNHSFPNNSQWGDGEFLVARTTFDVTDTDYDYFRIAILCDQGYRVYLNGTKIDDFGWFEHYPRYRKTMLDGQEAKLLRKGTNTLAVLSNVRFEPNRETAQYDHIGQLDLWLEGLKRADLESAR